MAWDREKEKKAGKVMTISSCAFAFGFSLFWCASVLSIGVWPMVIPGLFFVGITGYRLYVCIQVSRADKEKKPTQQKEIDPWDRPVTSQIPQPEHTGSNSFCPYCGGRVQADFEYCPKCGRRLA